MEIQPVFSTFEKEYQDDSKKKIVPCVKMTLPNPKNYRLGTLVTNLFLSYPPHQYTLNFDKTDVLDDTYFMIEVLKREEDLKFNLDHLDEDFTPDYDFKTETVDIPNFCFVRDYKIWLFINFMLSYKPPNEYTFNYHTEELDKSTIIFSIEVNKRFYDQDDRVGGLLHQNESNRFYDQVSTELKDLIRPIHKDGLIFYQSTDPNKKYTVYNNGEWIDFGDKDVKHFHDKIGLYKKLDHNDERLRNLFLEKMKKIKNKNGIPFCDNPMCSLYYSLRYLW